MPCLPPRRSRIAPTLAVILLLGCGSADSPVAAPPVTATEQQLEGYQPYYWARPSIVIDPTDTPSPTFDRSGVITDLDGLKSVLAVQKTHLSLGKLLEEVGNYVNSTGQTKQRGLQYFAQSPFKHGSDDVKSHNAWQYVKVPTTPTIYDSFHDTILTNWLPDDHDGPFRLLAVVNRIDLAGDYDIRGGGKLAGADRRWFGEGRLVFGLNQDLDGGAAPYPMTLIMEYRLPALKETQADGGLRYEVDPDFDYVKGPANNAEWIKGRQRWARIWSELSRYEPTDPS
jgi:hypothetical protein